MGTERPPVWVPGAHCYCSLVWEKPVLGFPVALRGFWQSLLAQPYLLPAVCPLTLRLHLGLVISKAPDPEMLLIFLKSG